ncbi:MAG: TonB-dependent receptor [Bacteroidota bacterium]
MKNANFILLFLFLSCALFGQPLTEKDTITWDLDLSDVIVTAQYAPTHSKNAIHDVKVIDAREIERKGHNNLTEALGQELNLRISADPILGNGISIQGIGGENVAVLIDGVPVIGRVNGNIDLSQINLNNVDRIEIVEGALSTQYGSNASGGVVNIITKKSQPAVFRFKSRNQYEDVGIWNNNIGLGVQLGKFFASVDGGRFESSFAPVDTLRLLKTVELEDGSSFQTRYIPWNPKTQYSLEGTLRYRFSDSTNIWYQGRYFDETVWRYGEVRRPQFLPYAFDETYTTKRQDHTLNFESYLGRNFYLISKTGFNDYDRIKTTERLDFEPDTTSLVFGGQDTTSFKALLHRNILSTTFNGKFNGQFGIEVKHEIGTGQRILDTLSAQKNRVTLNNYAFWGSLKYKPLNKLTILANLRYGYNTKFDHPLVPSVNFSWQAGNHIGVKAGYARGFRAPSIKELHFNFIDINHFIIGNPDIKPEHSDNIYASASFDKPLTPIHQISASGKVFYNHIRNRIVLAEFEPFKYTYQNLSKYETHGFNLNLCYEFDELLSLSSGFAYTRLYNLLAADFEAPKFTSIIELQNELGFDIPVIGTHLNVTHSYFGRSIRYFINGDGDGAVEQGRIGGYNMLNASVGHSFWDNQIFLSFGVKNILNVDSVPLSGESGGVHSTSSVSQLLNWGRTIFVKLNFDIKAGKL